MHHPQGDQKRSHTGQILGVVRERDGFVKTFSGLPSLPLLSFSCTRAQAGLVAFYSLAFSRGKKHGRARTTEGQQR